MKIPDTSEQTVDNPVADTLEDDSASSSPKPEKVKDSKSFSKVLAEKAARNKAEKRDSKPGADSKDVAQLPQPQGFRETAPVVQQPKQVAATSLPPAMQNLVQEIVVATGPQNRAQVDIQLNSRTFDGLKITLAHADGNVSIRMESRTPEIAAVLNRHLDQLSQALAARGVPVESIRVKTVTAPSAISAGGRRGNRSGRQS